MGVLTVGVFVDEFKLEGGNQVLLQGSESSTNVTELVKNAVVGTGGTGV